MKEVIKKIPIIGPIVQNVYRRWIKPPRPFAGSEDYWIARYASGGNSGAGSYNELSKFKAEIINGFVIDKSVISIIEYGCGDGNQLRLAKYPAYIGFDVSQNAISLCREIFANDKAKKFRLMKDYNGETARLTLSIDVIYHLIEDQVFVDYMNRLFDSAEAYVIIYSSDTDFQGYGQAIHVKHRKFTDWVQKNKSEWKLHRHIPNRYPFVGNEKTGSFADFYIYEKA